VIVTPEIGLCDLASVLQSILSITLGFRAAEVPLQYAARESDPMAAFLIMDFEM
jgi:hypothetical protein